MNLINMLVSEEVWWGLPKKLEFVKTIVNAIESVLWPVLIVVATLGTIYAVYLGINMAKAEDSGKRDEARKHLINAVIAMAVTVVLILLINVVVIPNIPGWVAGNNITSVVMNDVNGKTFESEEAVTDALGGVSPYAGNEWRVRVDSNRYKVTRSAETGVVSFALQNN